MPSITVHTAVPLTEDPPDLDRDMAAFVQVFNGAPLDTNALPIVWIHPADGSNSLYRNLFAGLEGTRKLITVEAPGFNDLKAPQHTSVEGAAREYLAAVLKIHEGPIILAGYSYGGLVAYEMAQILQSHGREPECLIMIETGNPQASAKRHSSQERIKAFFKQHNAHHPLQKAALLTIRTVTGIFGRLHFVFEEFWARRLPAKAGSVRRQIQLRIHHCMLFAQYDPKPYGGKVRLWMAKDQGDKYSPPANLGWTNLLTGNVCYLEMPGSHLNVLEEPNVGTLVESIKSLLTAPNTAAST